MNDLMKDWKRARKLNYHHVRPRHRGGKSFESNLIRLDINRHKAYHLLFKDRTFTEAAHLLLKADRIIKKK